MKKILGLTIALVLVLASCTKTHKNVKLENDNDSLSYLVGVIFGKQVKEQSEIEKLNYEAVAKGFAEVFASDTFKLNEMEIQTRLQNYLNQLHNKLAEKNKTESAKFLEENKKKQGVITLPSGLQYTVIKDGTGPVPDSSSVVNVHYVGSFINGKEFESSVKSGKPAQFPVTGVIKGWTEALLKMKVGSKWKLFLPSNLAYGEMGTRGKIKANMALIFEVELLSIETKTEPAVQPSMPTPQKIK